MKKIILTSAIIFGAFVASFAQATGTAMLNVKLNPIQTLVVNAAQKTVNLEYKNVADYANGVSLLQADHLSIYSTGAFAITVASATNDIKRTKTGSTETIASSSIHVVATEGTTAKLTGAILGDVALSTTATDLITSTLGGVNKTFNITYKGLDGNGYVNKYFNDESPTVYTTTVTYTIAAR